MMETDVMETICMKADVTDLSRRGNIKRFTNELGVLGIGIIATVIITSELLSWVTRRREASEAPTALLVSVAMLSAQTHNSSAR